MNSQAEAKKVTKIQWQRWICITIWLRMLQDDEPPKSSWRSRKSTKSRDQFSVQKFTKVTQSLKKGPSYGKIWPYRASWRGGHVPKFAMRQQRKTWVQSTKEAQWDIEMLFLWCFSASYWERILSSFWGALRNWRHIMLFNVWNWSLLRSEGQVQNWVRRRSYLLESLRSPRIEHLRSITTCHDKWQKIQYYAQNFVFLVVQGFKDSFFMLYFTNVSDIRYSKELWKFY